MRLGNELWRMKEGQIKNAHKDKRGPRVGVNDVCGR